jgi:predicted nuclease of predicted toxin-antitoxin system
MRLYLDEDVASQALGQALRKAGHDVVLASDANHLGRSDVLQLAFAVEANRALVTGNHRDFADLHELIILCGGSHPGILTVRKDNDRRRDLKASHIVRAIENVAAVMASLRNHLICLNDWR